MRAITYQRIEQSAISHDLLDDFNRRQEVKRCWRKENNQWVLKEIAFIEDWNLDRKRREAIELLDCIREGGAVFGAFLENKLLGFASLSPDFWGTQDEYLEMRSLQVSCQYRGQGIGKRLFRLVAEYAGSLGAKKIYISANSSEETQAFYKAAGCIEAKEVNQAIAEDEPFDCQMEYVL